MLSRFYTLVFKIYVLISFYDKTRLRHIIHFIYVYSTIRFLCSSLATVFDLIMA
jgi:hypothetical protein